MASASALEKFSEQFRQNPWWPGSAIFFKPVMSGEEQQTPVTSHQCHYADNANITEVPDGIRLTDLPFCATNLQARST
jgi:hypothetical protein